jgi:hypothetical protein
MTEETVFRCILHLDRQCDGARSEDGRGFNGMDTNYGKSLARQIRARNSQSGALSAKQLEVACRMLRTYSKQLKHILGREPLAFHDGGLVEARRLAEIKAVEGVPYYRGTVVGDTLEFVCQRRDLNDDFDMAKGFFKAVGCQWKPQNVTGPEKARWVIRIDKLVKLNWKAQMPACIELDPAAERKLAPAPRNISYPPIAEGTRQYQLEAILMMREG